MTMQAQTLASGPGWRVCDLACSAGPHDRPFEERHDSVCLAAVTRGTFRYRSAQGAALLAPGAVLLGNHGCGFVCAHDDSVGDHCVALYFSPEAWEAAVAAVPGARTAAFEIPRLPPLPALIPAVAALEAACAEADGAELEELALRFAGAVTAALGAPGRPGRRPSGRDCRRIAEAVRRIEAAGDEAPSLRALARDAAMSPYHFLRTFREVVGTTPHQFLLRTRLNRAAVRLRRSDQPVSTIAYEAGFNDLSSFNRRFRRVMGASPSAFRAGRSAA